MKPELLIYSIRRSLRKFAVGFDYELKKKKLLIATGTHKACVFKKETDVVTASIFN